MPALLKAISSVLANKRKRLTLICTLSRHQAALSAVKAWTSHPEMETAALMGTKDAATMMLALTPSRHMSLAEGSALCEKKDKIIALFDRLLSKLGGEELAANITYGKVDKEFKDTLATWCCPCAKKHQTQSPLHALRWGFPSVIAVIVRRSKICSCSPLSPSPQA